MVPLLCCMENGGKLLRERGDLELWETNCEIREPSFLYEDLEDICMKRWSGFYGFNRT